MLRRIVLYFLIGAAVYLGYQRYHESVAADLERQAQSNAQVNARAMQARQTDPQGPLERALRRRESTEAISRDAEAQAADRH